MRDLESNRGALPTAAPAALPDPATLRELVAHEWRFVLATFAASGIGYLGSSAAPVIVQALIDAGLSHRQAGDLGTFELTSLAVVSLLVTPYVPRVSHRRLAVGGTLLAAPDTGAGPVAFEPTGAGSS